MQQFNLSFPISCKYVKYVWVFYNILKLTLKSWGIFWNKRQNDELIIFTFLGDGLSEITEDKISLNIAPIYNHNNQLVFIERTIELKN